MPGHPPTPAGPHAVRLSALGAAIAALVVAALPTAPAQSAAAAACPPPVPARQIHDGMAVHGLTVTSGTTPQRFTGNVLGVLRDGIAPGLDMIMVQLSGAQITDGSGGVDKGIWAGMSGSPVYDRKGRLLGAVSYGLSYSPSDVAGLTPAYEMLKLLQGRPAALHATRDAHQVAIPAGLARSLVAEQKMSRAQADQGFHRLPMPFGVSGGFTAKQLAHLAKKFDIKRPLVTGGSASTGSPTSPIVPGGNLAASLSYGDITYAGVGTATAVCNGKVLAFGHPLLWSGRSSLSMHNANAIYIQQDTVFGSFKVANPTAPQGWITQDRLAGIVGSVGSLPPTTDVHSHLRSTAGNSRSGATHISVRGAVPYLAATHLVANALRVLDKAGAGSATLTWTAQGTRADGSAWQYSRSNTYASRWDIAYEAPYESYRQLGAILRNKFERVQVTDISFTGTYSPRYQALELSKVEAKQGGRWVVVGPKSDPIKAKAGTDIALRVTLTANDRARSTRRVLLSAAVPRGARGSSDLTVGEPADVRAVKASSFGGLLRSLSNAPRNDTVVAQLRTDTRHGHKQTLDSLVVGEVVSGSEHLAVRVTR